jgi:hypothetical protein
MAAVGGSAAACCAVLLAAVLLFSAPATTGSAPLLYLPQPGPSHPLDGAASCREPANWLDPAARSPPCIGETERPRGSDCVPVNATPISPSPVGVGGSSSVSVASNQDPTGLIQLDSEFRTRLRKPHTYLTHAKLPQCHSADSWPKLPGFVLCNDGSVQEGKQISENVSISCVLLLKSPVASLSG